MPVIRDPDYIDYGEYNVSTKINPYTASKNNAGQPAQLLIDYDDRKFVLTAPKYGEIGAGNTNLVGYGGTGGVTGQALYSKFKQIWKTDNIAIKFPFPMEAITPESFEFINGWEPDDDTEMDWFATNPGIVTAPAITRKLLRDCGWAERTTAAEGNAVKRKYFGIITLGAIALPTNDDGDQTVNATIYCSQLNPATRFTFNGSNVDTSNRVSITAPMPDLFTGSRVVYQEPTSTPVGFGLTHNNFYYIRFESSNSQTGARSGERHGTVGIGTTFRLRFFETQQDALTGTNPLTLTSGQVGVASIRHQTEAPNFFFDITEEGGAANEPFLYEFSAGAPDYQVYYNFDNYFKIYNREKARTYAEQAISQVGVTQINYQAYRIPLATSVDANLQAAGVDISDSTLGAAGDTYTGIGVSFHQSPVTYNVGGVPYQFNVTIDANQKSITAVYQYVQGLLRTPSRTTDSANAGTAYTSMNSLSAVGFGTDDRGARNEYGNDLRVGVTEEPLLEFIGNTLYAKLRNDIYSEINPGETNHGVYIANVSSGQLTDVVYYDNDGQTRTEPFVSSYNLVFNTNLNSDNDARFWIFYNTDETLPGITTTFDITAIGVVGSSDGIDDANDQFVSGNTVGFHPFVNGQEVVAIATVSDPGIGITCDTLAAGIVTYTIDNEGVSAYELISPGVEPAGYGNQTYTLGENNPTLYVYGGDTAEFNITNAGTGHPFYIKIGNPFVEGEYQTGDAGALGEVAASAGIASVFNNGGIEGGSAGIVTMVVPLNYTTGTQYYYICSNHEAMRGEIKILDKRQDSSFKYYVNAQKSVGVAQTYRDITESGDSPNIVGVGSTSTFRLHYTYLDAVANAGVGINTIAIQPSNNGNTGDVTFTQTDVNYQENNATIVQTSDKQFAFDDGQGNVGTAQTYARPFLYMDGIDVPSSGTFNFTFAYDSNKQRNRAEQDTKESKDASAKIVTIGLGGAQFFSQDFPITNEKNITVNIAAALERVYNDPTT
jgi:hypothetical protein